jgi:hypothetical protein
MTALTSAGGIVAVMPANSRPVQLTYGSTIAGNSPNANVGTYTVPAGKIAVLRYFFLSIDKTTGVYTEMLALYLVRNAQTSTLYILYSVTTTAQSIHGATEIVLRAGDSLRLWAQNLDASARRMWAAVIVEEIDL